MQESKEKHFAKPQILRIFRKLIITNYAKTADSQKFAAKVNSINNYLTAN